MASQDYTLPAIRRVVTGHDSGGLAVARSDQEFTATPVNTGDAMFTLLWTTATVPADNTDETDGRLRDAAKTLRGGSVLRVVDMRPGGRSPMHRSFSIDYGIVLQGQLDLELDGGEVKHLKAGDVVVQRGTNHAWVNNGAEWCRIAFILIEAPPIEVGGKVLEEIHP